MVKRIVWKYDIPIQNNFTLKMPFEAEILHFGVQYGKAKLWVLIDPLEKKIERRFRLAGTGHEYIQEGLKYIGTIKIEDDTLIFHLFSEY